MSQLIEQRHLAGKPEVSFLKLFAPLMDVWPTNKPIIPKSWHSYKKLGGNFWLNTENSGFFSGAVRILPLLYEIHALLLQDMEPERIEE